MNLDIPWGWGWELLDSCESENLAKNPFFFGGCFCCSSFNPTSSNDSSGVGGSLSKDLSRIDDLGIRENRIESRLWRVTSLTTTGDLAEMSFNFVQFAVLANCIGKTSRLHLRMNDGMNRMTREI